MKSIPLVSVIIPVFNRLEYIREAIESVLVQTYENYEIIVVNDGSTTDVKRVLEPYMTRIKYLYHQENRGLAAARNTGIRASKGKYLVFLDDDDLLEPRKLHVQVQILENNPEIGFVFSDGYVFDTDSPSKLRLNPAVARHREEKFSELFFMDTNVFVSSVLIRRECFEDVGQFDENLPQNEDSDMLLQMSLKWQGMFSDYPSTKIRHHPHRMSLDRIEIYESVLKSCQKILRLYPNFKKDLGLNADKRIADLHYLLVHAYIKNRKFDEAKRQLDNYFSSCKSIVWKARLYKLVLKMPHPAIIFNSLPFIRKCAEILLKAKSYLRSKDFMRIVQ